MINSIKAFSFVAALAVTSLINAVTFDFTGTFNYGTTGNVRSFSEHGFSVNASAWNSDYLGENWSAGALGQYNHGFGVIDNQRNGRHTVDNMNKIDYVLFEFSEVVSPDELVLAYSQDSDITIWIGNFSDPFNNRLDLASVTLDDFHYLEFNYGNGNRVADINDPGASGNVLLVAANIDERDDSFKIRSLKVPDSGMSISLLGMALFGVALLGRHFKQN